MRAIIFAPDTIKELLVARPFLSKLRQLQPSAQIDVMAPRSCFALLKYIPEVDHFFRVPFSEHSLSIRCRFKAIKMLKQHHYDHAFVLTDSWLSAWLAFFSGIPNRVGRHSTYRHTLINAALPPRQSRSLQESYLEFIAFVMGVPLIAPEQVLSSISDDSTVSGLILNKTQTRSNTQPLLVLESSQNIVHDQWLSSLVPYYLQKQISIKGILREVKEKQDEQSGIEKCLLFLTCDVHRHNPLLSTESFPSLPRTLEILKQADVVVTDQIETVLMCWSLNKEVIYSGSESVKDWLRQPNKIYVAQTLDLTTDHISRRLAACILDRKKMIKQNA